MNPSLPLATLLGHTADAVQAVRSGQSLNEALARCPEDARPGTQALSFEVLRKLGTATAVRAALVKKTPVPSVDSLLLAALALLLPQPQPQPPPGGALVTAPDPTPAAQSYAPHTVVDQAVKAVRKRHAGSAGFANAVLRRFVRERESLLAAVADDAVAQFNHPAWWIARLRADWPDHWRAILAADDLRPPMVLRVNRRRGSVDEYLATLALADLPARRLQLPGADGSAAQLGESSAIVLQRPVPVQRLPGFDAGAVSVQDGAAQLAAHLLLADSPELPALPLNARLLDACAAPGGKTAHLLELAGDSCDVLALDRDAQRLQRVDQTLHRLGLHARTLAADAAQPAQWWDGRPFDAILLDAPCSASGIVRRHPDIRWLRRAADIDALAQIQARLLDALWPLLKPGGRLLFCTCSVFKAEGEAQIDAFLQRQPDAFRVLRPPSPGHLLPLADNPQNQALPPVPDSDFFFHGLLAKR
ncbi:MAG: 16S rRNA (cytosine(967)-C(5))-methyltransferase RsmB [Ideonella sp.]